MLMTSVPLQWQKDYPTAELADSALAARTARAVANADANDMLYYFQASRDYNPAPHLEQDHGATLRHQFRRRPGQSPGARGDGARDRAR